MQKPTTQGGRKSLTRTHFHPCKLCSKTYNNNYVEIQKLMTQLDGMTLHHLLVSKVFTSKSPMCYSYVPCPPMHPMPPCTFHATPPKKGLANDLLPIWLEPLKLIAFFTTRAMVTPKIGIICEKYQFPRFYVK